MMSQKVEANMSLGFSQDEAIKAAETSLNADKTYQKLSQAAEEYDAKLQRLGSDLERVKAAESGMTGADTAEYQEKQAKLESLNGKLEVYKAKLSEVEQAERASSSQTQINSEDTDRYKRVINKAATETKNFGSKISSVTSKLRSMVKTGVSKFFRGLTSGLKSSTRHTGMLNKMTNIITRSFKRVFISGLVLRSLRSVLSGIKDGFADIAKINPGVNKSLSDLSSSFNYLKNSLSAAFIPTIQAATPHLVLFMDTVSGVINKITELASLIVGKDFYTKAIKQQKDYAASLDNSSDSLNKNTKAVEDNQHGLASFDELNVLSDISDSSVGGSETSASDFVNAEATADGIFAQIKNAIKNHDYREIGDILGDKINDFLSHFQWSKIKSKAKDWGQNIAGFFNGLFERTNWKQVGLTAAEGLNTAIAFMLGFSYTFDWAQFGRSFKDSIISFFQNLDKDGAIAAFDAFINGVVTAALELAGDPEDWKQWGADLENDLETAIKGINWDNVKLLFWNLLKGVFSFSDGFFGSLFDDLDKQLKEKDFKEIGNSFAKSFNSIDWDKTLGKESTIGKGIAVLGKSVIAGLDFIIGFLEEPGTADKISKGIETLLNNVPWAELLVKGLTAIFDATAEITEIATTLTTDFCSGLASGFDDMKTDPELLNALKEMGKALINCLVTIIESGLNITINAIPNLLLGLVKAVLDLLNVVLSFAFGEDYYNEMHETMYGNGPGSWGYFDYKVKLPRLATGTVVPAHFGEYLAVLGDNKREPEVVSPLSTMKQALAEVLAERGSDARELHLTVNLDSRPVFDKMVSLNGEYIKSHGYSAFAKG
jgi:hypothetical protein